ncbi:MAG TPA: hypothetical protein VGR96_05560 [Acidobacteriaceae bacterium]|nr:hypothetical protein [Acidobacteriaceae bacterium]
MKLRFRVKHRPGYLLLNGFRLVLDNWLYLFWICAAGFVINLLAWSPVAPRLSPSLAHGEATRRLAEALQTASLSKLRLHENWRTWQLWRPFPLGRVPRIGLSAALVEAGMLLFLLAGNLAVYTARRESTFAGLWKAGLGYFWRFLRNLIFRALVVSALLASLICLFVLVARHASKASLSPHAMLLSAGAFGLVLLLGIPAMLLWLDLIDIYTAPNKMGTCLRFHRAIFASLRVLRYQFLWILPNFLLACGTGIVWFVGCAIVWKHLVLTNRAWPAFLIVQLALFLVLACRLWQRGMEVALVEAAERSTGIAAALSRLKRRTSEREPTLQELVMKLKNEPWAKPGAQLNPSLFPDLPTQCQALAKTQPPAAGTPSKRGLQESLLADHARKIGLLEATAEEGSPSSEIILPEPGIGPANA